MSILESDESNENSLSFLSLLFVCVVGTSQGSILPIGPILFNLSHHHWPKLPQLQTYQHSGDMSFVTTCKFPLQMLLLLQYQYCYMVQAVASARSWPTKVDWLELAKVVVTKVGASVKRLFILVEKELMYTFFSISTRSIIRWNDYSQLDTKVINPPANQSSDHPTSQFNWPKIIGLMYYLNSWKS